MCGCSVLISPWSNVHYKHVNSSGPIQCGCRSHGGKGRGNNVLNQISKLSDYLGAAKLTLLSQRRSLWGDALFHALFSLPCTEWNSLCDEHIKTCPVIVFFWSFSFQKLDLLRHCETKRSGGCGAACGINWGRDQAVQNVHHNEEFWGQTPNVFSGA